MGTTAEKLAYLAETKSLIKAALETAGVTVPEGATFRDYATLIGELSAGGSESVSYILVTPDGTEIPAVEVSEETIFTATAADIVEGKVAATADGVVTGTLVVAASE